MNRILDIGHPLMLGNNEEPFIIKDILGKGASSVTYLAVCNHTEHVLKECNPLGLHMHRDDDGVLIPDTKLNEEKFKECLERFENGFNKQLAFRLTDDLKNTTSNVQATYRANGTIYIDMTFFKGKTYDQVQDESLYDFLRRMKALSHVVGHYHDMGYLLLDIKPQNIYTIPETPEMVMMFDFDSVVPEIDVEKTILLSYTDSWAAPEQKMSKYRKSICKATDLFAIGEIIFYRVMGRHSNADEHFDFSKYAYDRGAKIFENVNPRVFGLLDDLFHKTLCCVPANRIQTAKELIELLDEIIPLADPKEPFLISNLPTPKEFFIGRDAEIEDIHARLQQNPVLFLHGIGGIGKSELAKQYAKKYQSEYDTIIFAPYVTDIVSLIANDGCIQINNFSRIKDEKVEEYYERKLRKIKELVSDNSARILFIVDNLDTSEDKNIRLLFELGCRILITSRIDMVSIFKRPQMEITAFSDLSFARELFEQYYHFVDEESDDVDAIINLVQGHILAVELIAKQIGAEWSNIKTIRSKLEAGGMSSIGNEDIDNAKDDIATQDSAFGHIKALFDLSIFEKGDKDNELYVLANLSLMPFTGIDRRLFADWCDLDNHGGKTCVNNLIKSGWIQRNGESIFVHSLISEVVLEPYKNSNISICDYTLREIVLFIYAFEYHVFINKKETSALNILLNGIVDKLISLSICSFACAVLLNNLGCIYDNGYGWSRGFWKRDITFKCYKQALLINKRLFGEENQYTATSLNNLGSFYKNDGDTDQAQYYLELALKVKTKLLGSNHIDTAVTLYNLGALFKDKKEFTKALDYYHQVLEIYKCYYDVREIYFMSADLLKKISEIYARMSEYEFAKKNALKGLELIQQAENKDVLADSIELEILDWVEELNQMYNGHGVDPIVLQPDPTKGDRIPFDWKHKLKNETVCLEYLATNSYVDKPSWNDNTDFCDIDIDS